MQWGAANPLSFYLALRSFPGRFFRFPYLFKSVLTEDPEISRLKKTRKAPISARKYAPLPACARHPKKGAPIVILNNIYPV
jgi:hypothetical protein